MRASTTRALVAVVMSAIAVSGCSSGGGTPEVAAVVEKVKIKSEDTEELVDTYLNREKSPQRKDLPREQVTKFVLSYQIELTFLEQLAEKLGVAADVGERVATASDLAANRDFGQLGERRVDYVRELQAAQLRKAIAQKVFPDISISDQALQEEYERRAPVFNRNWKAKVRVGRFVAQESAVQTRERVQKGEAFDAVVTELGSPDVAKIDVDPVTAPLSAAVLDAIGKTPPGTVADAVQVGDAWLAILVEERHEVPRLTLDAVRGELTAALAARERDSRFQDWFENKFTKAHVEVDKHYGEWNARATAVS